MIETHMNRRNFLRAGASALACAALPAGTASLAFAAAPPSATLRGYRNVLVLIELKGGNDGFNTLVPYASSTYYALRPKIAVARDSVVQLDDRVGLHPSLAPLLPYWKDKQLAVLQGVGYPDPNLSHFRSIEIWDTASKSEEYLSDGWLTRTFARTRTPRTFAADGVIIGSNDLGPLAGGGTRAVALADTDAFLRQSRLAASEGQSTNKALAHILKVEADVMQAANGFSSHRDFKTIFPDGAFGKAIKTAAQVIANPSGVAVVRVSLSGFDTHGGQIATQSRLLGEVAQGIVALESALTELGRWDETLVLTYAEFGRRPKENLSNGTDHGTANAHFALGGRVRGGMYGAYPALDRLRGDGNVDYAIDFRGIYATALERWWGLPSAPVLGGRFEPLPFVSA